MAISASAEKILKKFSATNARKEQSINCVFLSQLRGSFEKGRLPLSKINPNKNYDY